MLESTQQAGAISAHVALGLALAACAGLRAFLPLLVVGVAGHFEFVRLSESFAWMSDWPALTVFGVAVVAELLADKLPLVDHLLDGLATFVKPAAGGVLAAAATTDWAPLYVMVAATLAGATGAGVVHLARAKLRLVSSVTTAGVANPLISVAEDGLALTGSMISLAAPVLVVVAFGVGIGLLVFVLGRPRRTHRISVHAVGDLHAPDAQGRRDDQGRREQD